METLDVTRLMDDQRQRWQRGDCVPVESYLEKYPNLRAAPADLLDLIYHEVVIREENGDIPRPEEYLRRFPYLREELRRQFEVHRAFSNGPRFSSRDNAKSGAVLPGFPPGYEVLERLGQGGFGVVYKARQTALQREVALKLLRHWDEADPKELDRFREEAQAAARLKHPHVVQIHAVEEYQPPDGSRPVVFLCLEYLEGGSLDDQLQGHPLKASAAAGLCETLARAAHYLHQRGLVHCDLKPANVLLDPAGDHPAGLGTPKLTDFGFAQRTDPEAAERAARFGGTASYMAPEQASKRGKLGPATDVYALGAILYELLTGRPPFLGVTRDEVRAQVLGHQPVPPSRLHPQVPGALETICLKCLQKEPEKRYESAEALAEDLSRFQLGKPITARPAGPGERLWLWCRRNPAVATLLAALLLVLAGSAVVLTAKAIEVWYERQEKEKAWLAEKQRADQLEIADYQIQFSQAYRAWLNMDIGKANTFLDACKPRLRAVEWYLLKRLSQGPRRRFQCQDSFSHRVAVSADGQRAAIVGLVGEKNVVRVIELESGKVLCTAAGGKLTTCAALSPDGNRLALGTDGDAALAVWDVARGQELWSQSRAISGLEGLAAVAFLENGARVLTACQRILNGDPPHGLELRQWEARSGKLLMTVAGPRRAAGTHVDLSPDGEWLAWMSSAATSFGTPADVLVCDTRTGKIVTVLRGHARRVQHTAISPDHRFAATTGDDGTVKIWKADVGKEWATLSESPGGVHALAFSLDGHTLAIAGEDRGIRLWDVLSGALRGVLRGHSAAVWALAFLPEGGGLVSGDEDGVVMVWNGSPSGVTSLPDLNGVAIAGTFRPKGSCLISIQRLFEHNRPSSMVRVTDVVSRTCLRELPGLFEHMAISRNGLRLAAAGNAGTRVWDLESGQDVVTLPELTGPVALDPEGQQVIGVTSAGHTSTLVLTDAATGTIRLRLQGPTAIARTLAVQADRRVAAVGYDSGEIILWDLIQGKEINRIYLPAKESVAVLALSPDGRQVLTVGSLQRAARVWDAVTGKEKFQLTPRGEEVLSAAYCPDGRRILTGGRDGKVRLWDAVTGLELMTLHDCHQSILWLAISGDQTSVAAGCWGNLPSSDILVWDARPLDAAGHE